MADNSILPKAQSALVDGAGRPTRAFYDFFRKLANGVQGQIDALAGIVATLSKVVASLGGGSGGEIIDVTAAIDAKADKATNVYGAGSLTGGGNLYSDQYLSLRGDVEAPPAISFYGVLDAAEGRGWQPLSANFATLDDGAGNLSLDLATVTDTGGGTLLRFVRDAWGRITGTSAATTTDLAEGSNLYFTDARSDARITLQKGQPSGLATLDVGGKLDAGQLPALAITETFVVGSQAAMLALTAQEGDVAVRTDLSQSFILTAAPASTLANWQELLTPASPVTSIFGRVGSVTAASGDYTKAQVGLSNVDNTSDVNKPVSTAQAVADALAVPLDGSRTMTGQLNIAAPGLQIMMGVAHSTIAIGPIQSAASDGNLVNENISCSSVVSFAPRHNFYRGRGTSASPADVQNNDSLGALQMVARIGGAWQNCAYLLGEVDGLPGATFAPGRISFATSDGASAATTRWQVRGAGHFQPGADNAYDIGASATRARVVYAATGSINTSDAREKTAVAPLTATELAAAADLSRAIGTYQWLAMVADKGEDAARHHAGLTVQRAIEIMQAHGLDPMRYGFICYDEWAATPEVWEDVPAQVDEDGNETVPASRALAEPARPAGDRYSFRTDELLLFIARGVDARLSALEARP